MTNLKTLVRAVVVNTMRKESDYDYVVAEEWFDTALEADYWLSYMAYLNALSYYDSDKFSYRKEEY